MKRLLSFLYILGGFYAFVALGGAIWLIVDLIQTSQPNWRAGMISTGFALLSVLCFVLWNGCTNSRFTPMTKAIPAPTAAPPPTPNSSPQNSITGPLVAAIIATGLDLSLPRTQTMPKPLRPTFGYESINTPDVVPRETQSLLLQPMIDYSRYGTLGDDTDG